MSGERDTPTEQVLSVWDGIIERAPEFQGEIDNPLEASRRMVWRMYYFLESALGSGVIDDSGFEIRYHLRKGVPGHAAYQCQLLYELEQDTIRKKHGLEHGKLLDRLIPFAQSYREVGSLRNLKHIIGDERSQIGIPRPELMAERSLKRRLGWESDFKGLNNQLATDLDDAKREKLEVHRLLIETKLENR